MKNRIREFRELRGLSQAELARRIGSSAAAVSRYEVEDSRINMPLLERLSVALDCDPCDLISEHDPDQLMRVPVRDQNRNVYLDRYLHQIPGRGVRLEVVETMDDSMAPTAEKGDLCLIDIGTDKVTGDGLYALIAGDMTIIRRATHNPVRRTIAISNDNPTHSQHTEAHPDELEVAGRVVGLVKSL